MVGRVACILILLLLAACASEPQLEPLNETNQTENVTVPEPEAPVVEPVDEDPEQPPVQPPERTPIEKAPVPDWLATFANKAPSYSYIIQDETLGEVMIRMQPGEIQYRPLEYFFEVEDDVITLSRIELEDADEDLVEDIEQGDEVLIHYAWKSGNNPVSGCYLHSSRRFAYEVENCIDVADVQLIHENLAFPVELVLAHDWYERYFDELPYKTEQGYDHEDDYSDRDYIATRAYYDNGDGTTTVLYVEEFFKFILKVQVLNKDNLVLEDYEYGGLTLG